MSAKDTLSKISELLGMSPKEQIEMSETKEEAAIVAEEKVELATMKLENGTVLEAEAFEAGNEVFIVSDDERVPLPVGEYELEDGRKLVVSEDGIIGEVAAESDEQEEEEVEAAEEPKAEYATKEEMSEVKAMIEDLAAKIEEMSKTKEEMSSQVEDETPTFKHSPEKQEEKRVEFRIAGNRPVSTIDRVLQNLNK